MSYEDQYWDDDTRQQRLADVEVTVLQSFWSTPRIESKGKAQFDGADKVQLYWNCRIDEVYQDYDKALPEQFGVQISPGEGWIADEHGVMVSHKDDPSEELLQAGKAKPIQFKGSSFMGKWLGLCSGKYSSWYTRTNVDPMTREPIVLDDGDEVEYDLGSVRSVLARRKANPRDAGIWVGMKFRLRGLGFYYRNTEGTPGVKVMPTAFLGLDEAVVADYVPGSAGSDGSGAITTGLVAHPELVSETLPGASAELVETITELVSKATSHPEFMRGALQVEEIRTTPDLKAAIMNASEGPWSKKGVALPDTEGAEGGEDVEEF